MDLSKCPPRIHDKEDQGKNPESKSDIPVYECAIHLLSLLLFDTSLYTFLSPLSTQNSKPSRALHTFS
jgi:hypothetical protein